MDNVTDFPVFFIEGFPKVLEDVAAVQNDVVAMAGDVERNAADITTLGVRGHWCAARTNNLVDKVGTIAYERITFSESNRGCP